MDAQAQPPPRQAMLESRRGIIQCVSPLRPKGGEQHSLADEGAQFRQIDRKPGTLYILWGKLYKYTYLYTQRRNIQYKKGIWNLDHLVTWGIPYANKYFRGISGKIYYKTTGIPCIFQKIPYSPGSEKSTSVDTLTPVGCLVQHGRNPAC